MIRLGLALLATVAARRLEETDNALSMFKVTWKKSDLDKVYKK